MCVGHYKARYYDPKTGRFLQTDPIGYEDQMNLYAYVHNDPLSNTDPTGEFANFIIGAAIGAVIETGAQVAQGMSEGKSFTDAVKSVDAGRVVAGAAVGVLTGGASAFARVAVTGTAKAIGANVAVKGGERATAAVVTAELAAGRGTLKEAVDAKTEGRDFDGRRAAGKATLGLVPVVGDKAVDNMVDKMDDQNADVDQSEQTSAAEEELKNQ